MGNLESDPRGTYLRWVKRLHRQLAHREARARTDLPDPSVRITLPNEIDKLTPELEAISHIVHHFDASRNPPPQEVFAIGLFSLGRAFGLTGHQRVAVAFYAKALKYNPNLPQALHNLGNYHLRAGRFQQAYNHFSTALRFDPKEADLCGTSISMSAVLAKLGRWREGLKCLLQAIRRNPEVQETYEALTRYCQNNSSFSLCLDTYEAMIRASSKAEYLRHIFRRNFRIGYFPFVGLHGIYISVNPGHPLDGVRVRLLAALSDATSAALKTRTAESFGDYLLLLRDLENRARWLKFSEILFTIHWLRGNVYAGQCLDAFSIDEMDFIQEPISFFLKLSGDERRRLFGDADLLSAAFDEMNKAFCLALDERIAEELDRLQLSALERNLVHLSAAQGDAEQCLFYIEAGRAMFENKERVADVRLRTRLNFLREHLMEDEALVCFYIYEVVVDVLTIIVISKDLAALHQKNMDFTQKEGIAPKKFITMHREGIDSLSLSDELDIRNALIAPLIDKLGESRSITFIPYSYLRNTPIELIGYEQSLWNIFEHRTYRYLPNLELFIRPCSKVPSKRSCIAIAFAGVKNPILAIVHTKTAVRDGTAD
jgi:tetratricopeptide (TPR) repeat protein